MSTALSKRASKFIERKILRDDVYEVILDRLLSGQYKPGQPLGIDGLARELGVSPTPVREALVQLEHTGMVTRAALKGYRLAEPLSSEQMAQLMDMRLVLEVAAVERAMRRATELLPELRRAHEEHERHGEKVAELARTGDLTVADIRPSFQADWAFHEVILHNCGNSYIAKAVDNLSFNVHRMRQNIEGKESDSALAVQEHRKILDAFESLDVVRVRSAMEAHLQSVLDRSVAEANELNRA